MAMVSAQTAASTLATCAARPAPRVSATPIARCPILVGMDLPVMPPVAPMLAKPVSDLPEGAWSFEPKWDGFRTIVFCDGDEVELGSRRERPMTRYFPEVLATSGP